MKLLADTSALLALYLADDQHHPAALEFLQATPRARFVLTEMILSEVATRLAVRAGPLRAAEVARGLLASRRYQVLFVDTGLITEGLATMERFSDKRLTFADCTSFAVMRRLGIQTAFTFDRDFRDCGFEMLPV